MTLAKLKAKMIRMEIRLRAAMARYRAAERAYVVAYMKEFNNESVQHLGVRKTALRQGTLRTTLETKAQKRSSPPRKNAGKRTRMVSPK